MDISSAHSSSRTFKANDKGRTCGVMPRNVPSERRKRVRPDLLFIIGEIHIFRIRVLSLGL